MPAPTTIDELLDLVRKSGVVDERRLATHVERLRAAGQLPSEPNQLAGLFVRDGVLTHFQAEQFLQGKWRRFTIGKYKVLERLGSGGMGSVYLCEHTLMRRRVAVKVLPAAKAGDTSSLERFYREARAVAALDHPNIVRAYDIDKEDNLHFLVMEHVDGSSLQDIIKRHGRMDVLRSSHYIRQAALGLQHAHETAGLVHRDIKPGNILVDRNGIVKVLDMGLARFFNDDEDILTKKYDENVLGTADYLAPEQALDSHSVDIRADIYSLGGTFYFCLTGRTPFAEGTVAQKLIWHQTRQPKPIQSLRPEVPEGLVAILERMLAKDPGQRYQTPQEVADALAPWTGTPIPPPPEHEMPQFSLAASNKGNTGSSDGGPSSASSPRGNDLPLPPPAPKPWTVQPSTPGAATATAPALSAPSQSTTPVLRSPPPAPARVPAPRPAPAAERTPPAPQPNGATRPAPAPAPMPVPAPVPALELPAAAPAPLPPFLTEEAPPAPTRDPDESLELPPPPSGRRRRPQTVDIRKKRPLLLWLGIAAGGLLLLGAVLLYVLTQTGERPGPPPRVANREAIRVPSAIRTLSAALRQAQPGDRILLDGDITEASLSITKPRITIEAEAGKTVTWKCPAKVESNTKLLMVQATEGFHLKGLTLDGGGQTEALIVLYGRVPGTTLSQLTLDNTRQYGIHVANCEGEEGRPVTLNDVTIHTSRADQTAVRFEIFKHSVGSVSRNRYLTFQKCKFLGAGGKLTTADPAFVDLATITLPPGLTIERIP